MSRRNSKNHSSKTKSKSRDGNLKSFSEESATTEIHLNNLTQGPIGHNKSHNGCNKNNNENNNKNNRNLSDEFNYASITKTRNKYASPSKSCHKHPCKKHHCSNDTHSKVIDKNNNKNTSLLVNLQRKYALNKTDHEIEDQLENRSNHDDLHIRNNILLNIPTKSVDGNNICNKSDLNKCSRSKVKKAPKNFNSEPETARSPPSGRHHLSVHWSDGKISDDEDYNGNNVVYDKNNFMGLMQNECTAGRLVGASCDSMERVNEQNKNDIIESYLSSTDDDKKYKNHSDKINCGRSTSKKVSMTNHASLTSSMCSENNDPHSTSLFDPNNPLTSSTASNYDLVISSTSDGLSEKEQNAQMMKKRLSHYIDASHGGHAGCKSCLSGECGKVSDCGASGDDVFSELYEESTSNFKGNMNNDTENSNYIEGKKSEKDERLEENNGRIDQRQDIVNNNYDSLCDGKTSDKDGYGINYLAISTSLNTTTTKNKTTVDKNFKNSTEIVDFNNNNNKNNENAILNNIDNTGHYKTCNIETLSVDNGCEIQSNNTANNSATSSPSKLISTTLMLKCNS